MAITLAMTDVDDMDALTRDARYNSCLVFSQDLYESINEYESIIHAFS